MHKRLASLVGFCGLVAFGCGPLQNRVPDVAVSPAQLAAAPVVAMAYELDFSGNRTIRAEWAAKMAANIGPEMKKLVVAGGGRAIAPEDFAQCPELFESFHTWGTVASMEIAAQLHRRADYGSRSVGDWQFRRDLGPLRNAMNTDFVVFMTFREGFQTAGRKAASLFAGVRTFWIQVGAVCIADLRDGRMVWCVSDADNWGDLRLPIKGQSAAQKLLRPILGEPLIVKHGTPIPPPAYVDETSYQP